jgi:hypothetical protein
MRLAYVAAMSDDRRRPFLPGELSSSEPAEVSMARIARRRRVDRAKETLVRIAPLIFEIEMQQHLRNHRDRNKKIHERAKEIVRVHEANKGNKRLVYKTRMKGNNDV